MASARKSPLGLGEAAPWFRCATLEGNDQYAFDSAGGRAILMLFFGSAANPAVAAALAAMERRADLFDDDNACFFGITVDPTDAAEKRIRKRIPGIRFFLDYDRAVSRAYGAADEGPSSGYRGHWLLLDRALAGARPVPADRGRGGARRAGRARRRSRRCRIGRRWSRCRTSSSPRSAAG